MSGLFGCILLINPQGYFYLNNPNYIIADFFTIKANVNKFLRTDFFKRLQVLMKF